MHSHLSHILATQRTEELRRAADRAPLTTYHVAHKQRARRPRRIARLRTRVVRFTARFAETGS
jgi:hypothetical protein